MNLNPVFGSAVPVVAWNDYPLVQKAIYFMSSVIFPLVALFMIMTEVMNKIEYIVKIEMKYHEKSSSN